MDPITVGAVLVAIIGGAAGAAGTDLWTGLKDLIRYPFRHRQPDDAATIAVPKPAVSSGEAELAALEAAPANQGKAQALAEALISRANADAEFGAALHSWWDRASCVRVNGGDVKVDIRGGIQHGPVIIGRDISNLTFGAPSAAPEDPNEWPPATSPPTAPPSATTSSY